MFDRPAREETVKWNPKTQLTFTSSIAIQEHSKTLTLITCKTH